MVKPALIALMLLWALPCAAAPGDERWIASSKTASSITGDVRLEANRVVFTGGKSLPIERVRNIDFADEIGKQVPASLYRVTRPADPILLRGNQLCGGPNGPVTFFVIWHTAPLVPGEGEGRALAAYTGASEPRPTANGACATYHYAVRP